MNVSLLSREAQLKLLDSIVCLLETQSEEDLSTVLKGFVATLDSLDNDDFFGTEGWKYGTWDEV